MAFVDIDLNQVVRDLYAQPITRSPRGYGMSGVRFCMEKQVLSKRSGIPVAMNDKMLTGKVYHDEPLKQMVEKVYPSGWNPFKRNRYRVETSFKDPRGFVLEGHPDAVLPRYDRVIELKTTNSQREWKRGDFLAEAYIEQANAYAYVLGKPAWEVWIICLQFEDIMQEDMVTRMWGETEKPAWETFLERTWMIDQGVVQGIDLVGPEQEWECRRCQFLFDCPQHKVALKKLIELLPAKKADLPENIQKELELMAEIGVASYDRTAKLWRLAIDDPRIKDKQSTSE